MKNLVGKALTLTIGLGLAAPAVWAQTTHQETTTESKTPGSKTVKTKTETVIGVVKTYDAGKKIVVTGPKNKDYSFDLDENAGVTGDIAVGQKVKVTYSKTSGNPKVTTVAPYVAKKKTKA